jgi:uncharacterized integral membrane protein
MDGSATPDGESTRGKQHQARQITIIALAAVAAIFALLNLDDVKVNFILGTTKAPLIIVIVACVALGVVLGLAGGRRRAD